MALSIAQLLTPMSRQEALDALLLHLDALGFSASSWQSGGKRRTIIEIGAIVWADMSLKAKALTEAVFLVKASGVLLTEFCKSHYDLTRQPAVTTRGDVILTAAATSGPHVIAVGQLVVSDTANGYSFRNITGGTLLAGSTLSLTFEAETAGADRNVGLNTLTVLQTPIAGVTANNPGSGSPLTWITRNGEDAESDANLRLRAIARWALLSIERPADGYIGIALEVDGVARVQIDATNPGGEGTVDVYAAGPTGTVGTGPGSTLEALQTALDAKRAISAIVTAIACQEQPVNVTATVYVDTTKHTSGFEDAVEDAVEDFINGLPIGGLLLPGALSGVVDREGLIAAIQEVDGAISVSMSTPSADVAVAGHSVATVGTILLSYVDVTA